MMSRQRQRQQRRLSRIVFFSAIASITAVVACGLDITGVEVPVIDVPDTRGEASLPPEGDSAFFDQTVPPDSEIPDAGPPCGSNLKGPAMVQIPDAGFCIDETEVTGAQYGEFLAATAGGADAGFLDASTFDGGLPPACPKGFAPGGGVGLDAGALANPVSDVSWCDAFAYCEWAGKRLCKGVLPNDAGLGEWQTACTHDGERRVPTVDGDAAACNVGHASAVPPKSFPTCEGGYSGIFDMVGNVEEWVDECAANDCALYGGNFSHAANVAACATVDRYPSTTESAGFGIRCCR